MLETQTQTVPPPPIPPAGVAIASGEFDDTIKELGDRIAALNKEEVGELLEYLDTTHGWDL